MENLIVVVILYRQVYCSTVLRSAHTLSLCVLCGSENKQWLFHYTTLTDRILGAFVNLLKEIISFVMSDRVEQLESHWKEFN